MVEDRSGMVGFNMSALQIGEVFNLLSKSNTYFLAGDFLRMRDCLIAVKLSAIQSFKPEERKALKDLENSMEIPAAMEHIYKNKSELNKSFESMIRKGKPHKKNFKELVIEYKELLMDTLEAHGYLIKKMEDYTTMF